MTWVFFRVNWTNLGRSAILQQLMQVLLQFYQCKIVKGQDLGFFFFLKVGGARALTWICPYNKTHLLICGGSFCNCGLGCLLPRYGLKVLGRRVRIGLAATHLKPVCAQTKTPLLKLWWHAYGRGNYYKRVIADRYNIATIKGSMLIVSWKAESIEWNRRWSNVAI